MSDPGPSSTDPGLGGSKGGGASESVVDPASALSAEPSYAIPAAGTTGQGYYVGSAATGSVPTSLSVSAPIQETAPAASGGAGVESYANPATGYSTSSLANPGGVQIDPSTYGNVTGEASAGAGAAPAATAASAPPSGVAPQYDPTQAQAQGQGQTSGGAELASGASPATSAAPAAKSSGFSLDSLLNPKTLLALAGTGYNIYQGQQALKGVPTIGEVGQGYAQQQEQLKSLTDLLLKQSQQPSELTAQGQQLIQGGIDLQNPLAGGQLPEGYQTMLEQAKVDARQSLLSNYASRGLPTDPTKNSSLAAELAALDRQSVITGQQLAQQLATQGISQVNAGANLTTQGTQSSEHLVQQGIQAAGLQSDLYKQLASIDQAQTTAMGKAIANLSAALAGGPTGSKPNTISVNIPG